MYQQEDDRVSSPEIRAVTKQGTLPDKGSKMTYKFQKPIGIAFEHDSRGYAIIHTARELLGGPWYQHDCVINDATKITSYNTYDLISLKTTITATYIV